MSYLKKCKLKNDDNEIKKIKFSFELKQSESITRRVNHCLQKGRTRDLSFQVPRLTSESPPKIHLNKYKKFA